MATTRNSSRKAAASKNVEQPAQKKARPNKKQKETGARAFSKVTRDEPSGSIKSAVAKRQGKSEFCDFCTYLHHVFSHH